MQPRQILSLGNFFSSAHFFLLIYIVGPYLATFMREDQVGLVISFGAVLTFLAFPIMPRLVRKYGAKRLAIYLGFAQAIILSILAGNPSAPIAIAAIALACSLHPLIAYQFDLLLEATVAKENATGRIRTAFLTAGNLALVLAPLAVGFLLGDADRYDFVFFAAAVTLTPFLMIFLMESLPEGKPPRTSRFAATCRCIVGNRDLRAVAAAQGVLQLFFHLAPFYVPLYLHTVLGMPWSQLGWIFAVAVIPFVLIEYPAGWVADRYLGDRKLLFIGFLLMGLSFSAFAFVTAATPLFVIVIILLLTRIGAALTEAMTEGHFFRRVSERDASTVSVFRMMRPAGAFMAPLIGSLILFVSDYNVLFFSTGIAIALLGVVATRTMQEII